MRSNTYQRGLDAEAAVATDYQRRGYTILATRYKSKNGELDIVAQRGAELVFIEVKARATLTAGLEAISLKQQSRLFNAAQDYLAANSTLETSCRFDVAVALSSGRVDIFENVIL
ncbi:MAG: YraN family protein [Alphaproteobacteria bacterium]|nr:YraN family protein [Alphaproteobacteria bacterium]